jgi:hypothetical protein
MQLDLTDEETFALLNLLMETIEADRYPLSPRIRLLRQILAKFGPMAPAPRRRPGRRHRRSAIRDERRDIDRDAGRADRFKARPPLTPSPSQTGDELLGHRIADAALLVQGDRQPGLLGEKRRRVRHFPLWPLHSKDPGASAGDFCRCRCR